MVGNVASALRSMTGTALKPQSIHNHGLLLMAWRLFGARLSANSWLRRPRLASILIHRKGYNRDLVVFGVGLYNQRCTRYSGMSLGNLIICRAIPYTCGVLPVSTNVYSTVSHHCSPGLRYAIASSHHEPRPLMVDASISGNGINLDWRCDAFKILVVCLIFALDDSFDFIYSKSNIDSMWEGETANKKETNRLPTFRPLSNSFLYARLKNGRIMLWQCPSVCPSVRPSVRPSFPGFFSTCFEISIWNLVYAFSRWHDMSSLSFIKIGSLWPSLQPKVGQTQFLQSWPYKSR